MDIKKLYREHMDDFNEVHVSIKESVEAIFANYQPSSLADVYDIRVLVEKSKDVLKYIDSVIGGRATHREPPDPPV